MPIRFRCKSCEQLLGIARRKAGTWVSCPTCRSNVLVPDTDEAISDQEPAASPDAPGTAPGGVFDRDDFDVIMARGNGPAPVSVPPARGGAAAYSAPPPPVPSRRPSASLGSSSQWQGLPAGGMVLSPARATLLTVVLILLLATSFVAGLLVGRFAL